MRFLKEYFCLKSAPYCQVAVVGRHTKKTPLVFTLSLKGKQNNENNENILTICEKRAKSALVYGKKAL